MTEASDRVLVVLLMYAGGFLLAASVVAAIAAGVRSTRRSVNRARGAERPDWAPGIWMCAHCKSSNHPSARTCTRCRRPREDLARREDPVPDDVIPEHIRVPERTAVALVHDPAAHTDAGAGHWRLRIGGQTAAVAARRDGALVMLRAIEGTDEIAIDLRGTGTALYRLSEVIARFEAPAFPLDVPCPERTA